MEITQGFVIIVMSLVALIYMYSGYVFSKVYLLIRWFIKVLFNTGKKMISLLKSQPQPQPQPVAVRLQPEPEVTSHYKVAQRIFLREHQRVWVKNPSTGKCSLRLRRNEHMVVKKGRTPKSLPAPL